MAFFIQQGVLIKRLNFVFLVLVRGEISREPGVISKISKTFLYQQKPKRIVQIYCRLSPQCNETIDQRLWAQMDLVRMGSFQGLEFSFPKCTRACHEVVPFKSSVDFFSWFTRIISWLSEGVLTPFSPQKVKILVILLFTDFYRKNLKKLANFICWSCIHFHPNHLQPKITYTRFCALARLLLTKNEPLF